MHLQVSIQLSKGSQDWPPPGPCSFPGSAPYDATQKESRREGRLSLPGWPPQVTWRGSKAVRNDPR